MPNSTTKTETGKSKNETVKRQKYAFTFYFLLFTFYFDAIAALRLCVFAIILSFPVLAQRVAVISPDKTETGRRYSEKLESSLGEKLRILDDALGEAAFAVSAPKDPFNLTADESKKITSAIGCDFLILIRPATIRRSSYQKPEYYESSAAIYAISSRTGRLVFWRLSRFDAARPAEAEKVLLASAETLAGEMVNRLRTVTKEELEESPAPDMEQVPDDNSPGAKNFRSPVPYRRIKPEYTANAYLYDIKATVDILVDLDATGAILRTEIVRWAGYGLDQSVAETVSKMNWRPAERNGKPLPMRFLLRYNFKKIEKQ